MKAEQFIQTIRNYSERPLAFAYGDGQLVQGGYHVTEIKNARYETIDCGNSLHTWQEVIVQLWLPDEVAADAPLMSNHKFAKIWQLVDQTMKLKDAAQIRIEYGDNHIITANYAVSEIVVKDNLLVVQMIPPMTECKPRSMLADLSGVPAACCPPVSMPIRDEDILPLPIINA